jgi:hypothetical protein
LKWPFTGGEAEKTVLASLEKKTGKQFDGGVWKFVAQAGSLGIEGIDLPARRPRLEDTRIELAALYLSVARAGSIHDPSEVFLDAGHVPEHARVRNELILKRGNLAAETRMLNRFVEGA